MRNLLLKTLFPITRAKHFFSEHTQGTWPDYLRMHELSLHSFRKNLLGDWQEITVMEPPQHSLQEAFRHTAILTQQIYQQHQPCRILYTDPDTVCARPLDLFGRFTEFRLFDQMDQTVQPLSAKWDGYWNCSVRYFPEHLDEQFWKRMWDIMEGWDYERYDYEQEMYRQLMWSQPVDTEAWQSDVQFGWRSLGTGRETPTLDNLPPHSVIHFGASGDVGFYADQMQACWKLLNG